MIGMYSTPAVDYRGKPCKRLHRTNSVFESGGLVITDIENYQGAWAIRKLTEKFIKNKIAIDLENYETKDKDMYPDLHKELMK